MTLAGAWRWDIASRAAALPLGITLTVIVADVIFGRARGLMDRALGWVQARAARPLVCCGAVFVIALLSAILTAIVAALMLAEVVELMRLGSRARVRVTVAGCFAIGLGSSLTPLGGPLSTLAASGLRTGSAGCSQCWRRTCSRVCWPARSSRGSLPPLMATRAPPRRCRPSYPFANQPFAPSSAGSRFTFSSRDWCWSARLLLRWRRITCRCFVSRRSTGRTRFQRRWTTRRWSRWKSTRWTRRGRAPAAILALLLAGGMLIPGNIPNIVAAAALRIGAGDWARIGIPMGLALLGIYFALLLVAG